MPKVTILIPLFNQADTIDRCLDSVFAQTFTDYALIVADDLSPDASADIAARRLEGRENCTLVRHTEKQYFNNFPWLIAQVQTEYFVLLAGDDYWEPTFLERTVAVMDADENLVGCVPGCQHYHEDGSTTSASDTGPLRGSFDEKLKAFLVSGFNNNRMYGLYRTALAQGCYPATIMHAQDIAFTINTLAHGDYGSVDEVLMHRDFTPLARYVNSVARDEKTAIRRLFPFLSASASLWRTRIIPHSWATLRKLMALNFILHHRQVRHLHPRYYRIMGPIYRFLERHLVWRL